MEAERPAADLRLGRVGDQGVARRSADALADPIGDADAEQLPRKRDDAGQRPRQGGQGIAEHDEPLASAAAVRAVARPQLHEAADRFRRAVDDAQPSLVSAEDGDENSAAADRPSRWPRRSAGSPSRAP